MRLPPDRLRLCGTGRGRLATRATPIGPHGETFGPSVGPTRRGQAGPLAAAFGTPQPGAVAHRTERRLDVHVRHHFAGPMPGRHPPPDGQSSRRTIEQTGGWTSTSDTIVQGSGVRDQGSEDGRGAPSPFVTPREHGPQGRRGWGLAEGGGGRLSACGRPRGAETAGHRTKRRSAGPAGHGRAARATRAGGVGGGQGASGFPRSPTPTRRRAVARTTAPRPSAPVPARTRRAPPRRSGRRSGRRTAGPTPRCGQSRGAPPRHGPRHR